MSLPWEGGAVGVRACVRNMCVFVGLWHYELARPRIQIGLWHSTQIEPGNSWCPGATHTSARTVAPALQI